MTPRRRPPVRSAILAVWLSTGLALCAQTPSPQRPVFQGGVDLVQIDVVALDKDGHPVPGLTAADFTLLDRKKPQKIETFEEITRPRTSEPTTRAVPPPAAPVKLDVATNQIPASDRLVVMVLDDLHVFSGRTDRVKTIAREVLDALGPGSSISVLFTSGRQSVEFTRDKGELEAAVDTFVGQSAVRRPNRGAENASPGRKVLDDSVPVAGARVMSAPPSFGGPPDVGVGLQQFFDDMTLHRTMEDAARMLIGAAAGRKAFVLVSEGTANNLDQMFKSRLTPCEIYSPQSPCHHQRTLLLAVEAMQRANVSLYAFDARGYVSNDDILAECAPTSGVRKDPCVGGSTADPHNWIRTDQHGFEITAAATGGFAVTNSDDFSGGVARMVAEIDHYYLLGFVPTDPKGSGFRPVDVMVKNRPDVTLHFRQGYTVTSAEDGAADKKTQADPTLAMSEGILPRTDLSLRLMAEPMSSPAGQEAPKDATIMAAILEVAIPRAEVRQADGRIAGQLRYSVLAGSLANGRVVAEVSNTATLSASGAGSGDTFTIELPIQVALPPGRYQLRASALLASTSRGGSVYLDVDVPNDRDSPLVLGGPFIGLSSGGTPLATGSSAVAWPFAPSLDRRFISGDQLEVFCPIIRRPTAIGATIEVRNAAGQVVASASEPEGTDPRAIYGRVSLVGLTPGGYTLHVHAIDGTHVADRQIGFVVVDKK